MTRKPGDFKNGKWNSLVSFGFFNGGHDLISCGIKVNFFSFPFYRIIQNGPHFIVKEGLDGLVTIINRFTATKLRSEEHTSELQSRPHLVCRLLLEKKQRPVKAAELFAFTLRVRAGNTDVLTDAEENVRQKLRAEGVM